MIAGCFRRSPAAVPLPGRSRASGGLAAPPQLTLSNSDGDNTRMPVPRISKEELKQRLEAGEGAGLVLLDVRLKYPYEHSTVKLPGALRMPADAVDIARLPRDKEIVAYDSDPDEVTSSHVAADLIRKGLRASALRGGIAEWMGASYPVETKESARPATPAPGALKG